MNLSDFEEISALLSYKPPAIRSPTFVDINSSTTALSFYDMHLSPNLALRQVVYQPTLLQDMTKQVDGLLTLDEDAIKSLPVIVFGDSFRTASQRKQLRLDTKATDAASIAKLYEETTAANCEAVASTILLTPQCSSWRPSVTFGPTYNMDNPTDQLFALEEYSLSLLTSDDDIYLYPMVKECIDQEKMQLLRTLWKKDPRLATWEFLPYTTQAVTAIENLCREMSSDSFEMQTYPPVGAFQEILATVPSDADDTPWLQHPMQNTYPREATDLAMFPLSKLCPPSSARSDTKYSKPKVKVVVSSLGSQFSTVEQLLQHAWVTACRRDSTFIVLQCGNYERIGIRHRASQALYLSDLIDVPNMTDPGTYTKLHLGLYISILQDAMQRGAHISQGEVSRPPQKCGQQEDGPSTRPQQRLRSEHATRLSDDETDDTMTTNFQVSGDITSRNLLLVFLQYGIYSSPHPTTFFRCGHRHTLAGSKEAVFKATEYIRIKLTSLIARGATGSVHEGTLQTYREDKEPVASCVIAKLAFDDAQKERMKHEAIIYEHLAKAGVRGIPECCGIFEDLHDGPLVLVTTHGGLWVRHWIPEDSGIAIPTVWREKFLRTMKEIHDTGICHRDIRPENLMVNAAGDVCIVGFDKADTTSSVGARKREYEHLEHLLAGAFLPPPGGETSPSSGLSPRAT